MLKNINIKINTLILCHLLLALFYIVSASAQPDPTLNTLKGEDLKAFVSHYALKNVPHQDNESIEVEVMQLDHNISLPSCSSAIDISMSRKSLPERASAVQLSCNEKPQWNIFVPISVKVFTDVLVTNRLILTGEPLSANDVTFEKQDKNRLIDGYFTDEDTIVGLVARHSINAGAVLTTRNIKQLPLIKRNQTISLALVHGAIEIDLQGIAKSDGYLNDTIKVLNPSSKKIIDAIVKDSGKAEINY